MGGVVSGRRGRRPDAEILAFGDSLTAGFGLPPDQGFPAQLERRLRADGIAARVVNAGVSGDTTAGGLARLDWSLADKPDLVILELGANDMLRGADPDVVRANLDAMIDKSRRAAPSCCLSACAPCRTGARNTRRNSTAFILSLRARTGWRFIRFFSMVSRWIRNSISRTVSTQTHAAWR